MTLDGNSTLAYTAALACGALAVIVFGIDRRSAIHALLAAGLAVLGLTELFTGFGADARYLSEVLRWQRWRFVAEGLLPGIWLPFSLMFGRFNSRETLRRWRGVVAAFVVVPFGLAAFSREDLFAIPPGWNEFVVVLLPVGWSGRLFHLCFLLAAVLILMNLEASLRSASGTRRWGMKFLVLGVATWFAAQIYLVSQALLFSAVDLSLAPINSAATLVACALILVSLFRDRVLRAEIYFSPSALYNSIALSLVAVYLIAVGLLAKGIDYFGASDQLSLATLFVFLALVGLAVILLSDQLRLSIRRFVVRNFTRPHYDYRKEWTAFTERTSSLVDEKDLCAAIARRVAETFGVPAATVWLFDESGDRAKLGGSTLVAERRVQEDPSLLVGAAEILRELDSRRSTIDFTRNDSSGSAALAEAHRAFFGECQVRYGAPLVAAGTLIGALALADRATHEEFSLEDFDLLKTIADQAAATLLNLELSRRLLKAKEMEAFQTLSAFFTHDLKNLASMLSLTMQNLPANYDNPEFRADALRVISESVAKMNAMCGQLGTVTRELELRPREVDLNEIVERTLASVNGSLRTSVVSSLEPVPKITVDPEQIEKVLVNFLLNANEATAAAGEIRVATTHRNGWLVLTVADDGCGMSEEFIAHSLFQPFRTTKSEGLGIGLFQSRRIVEAHRGRIAVESVLDQGSTFRIELPLK